MPFLSESSLDLTGFSDQDVFHGLDEWAEKHQASKLGISHTGLGSHETAFTVAEKKDLPRLTEFLKTK